MTFYSTDFHRRENRNRYGINGFQGPSRRAFGAARELKKTKKRS
jgi:hypothetical protein